MRIQFLLTIGIVSVLAGCSAPNPRVVTTPNRMAALEGKLPADPLGWHVITAEIDHCQSTMSTLFGNEAAVRYARTHANHNYPAGSVLGLVTWNQQEDARWFGANIPASPRSVEFVTVTAGPANHPTYSYRAFAGKPLAKRLAVDEAIPEGRTAYILGERSAVFP